MSSGRDEIVGFLDGLLAPDSFRDACPNGLQVYGKSEVTKLATCVSVSAECFEQAVKNGAHAILVHHGMFWEGASRVVDKQTARRLKILLESEINLLAYHLPLDAHREFGNNARLARILELKDLSWEFAHFKNKAIGCSGSIDEELSLGEIAGRLADKVGGSPQMFGGQGFRVKDVGIVSGEGGDIHVVTEASDKGLDAIVTGVVLEQTVAYAREAGIGMVALGHYNSEKLGVRACGDAIGKELGIEVIHLDVPNPVRKKYWRLTGTEKLHGNGTTHRPLQAE